MHGRRFFCFIFFRYSTIFPLSISTVVSHSAAMSSRLWLARRIVFPSSFSFKNNCRISCTPWLSRPFMGSSRIRRNGSSMMACAMPRRWRIPREYLPTCFFASGSRPTFRMASSISFFPIFPRMPARNCRFCLALYPGRKPGVSMIAPMLSGASILLLPYHKINFLASQAFSP